MGTSINKILEGGADIDKLSSIGESPQEKVDRRIEETSATVRSNINTVDDQNAEIILKDIMGQDLSYNESCFLLKNVKKIKNKIEDLYGERQKYTSPALQEYLELEREIKKFESGATNYNFGIIESEEPSVILNRLTIEQDVHKALELTPPELASIMPRLQIYIRKTFPDGQTVKQPLIFDDYLKSKNLEQITENAAGRGAGVGIKKFDYHHLPTTGHAKDIDIRGNFTIHFQSLEDFFEDAEMLLKELQVIQKVESVGSSNLLGIDINDIFNMADSTIDYSTTMGNLAYEKMLTKARFIDLIPGFSLPGVKKEVEVRTGWSVPEGNIFDEETKKFINKVQQTLIFTIVGYDINVSQDGTIEMSFTLQGRFESLAKTSWLDIYNLAKFLDYKKELKSVTPLIIEQDTWTGGGIERANKVAQLFKPEDLEGLVKSLTDTEGTISERKALQQEIGYRGCDDEDNFAKFVAITEQIELLENHREILDRARNQIRMSALPRLLLESESFYTAYIGLRKFFNKDVAIPLAESDIKVAKLKDYSQLTDSTAIAKGIKNGEKQNGSIQNVAFLDKDVFYKINFFFLGDLFNIILPLIYENDTMLQTRVILGPLLADDVVINLAEIPIPYDNFMQWYWKKTTGRKKDMYSLYEFMKDILNELLIPVFAKCFDNENSQTDFNISTFYVQSNEDYDPIFQVKSPWDLNQRSIKLDELFFQDKPRHGKNTYEYVLLHAIQKTNDLIGNFEEDNKRGILHFRIGSDRGILQEVNFSRDDDPGGHLAAYRTRTGDIMTYVFTAELMLFGCPIFSPGQVVYIDPTLMGAGNPKNSRTLANYLNLGGYHLILEIMYKITEDGTFETILKTFPSLPDGTSKRKSIDQSEKAEKMAKFQECLALYATEKAKEQVVEPLIPSFDINTEKANKVGDTGNRITDAKGFRGGF